MLKQLIEVNNGWKLWAEARFKAQGAYYHSDTDTIATRIRNYPENPVLQALKLYDMTQPKALGGEMGLYVHTFPQPTRNVVFYESNYNSLLSSIRQKIAPSIDYWRMNDLLLPPVEIEGYRFVSLPEIVYHYIGLSYKNQQPTYLSSINTRNLYIGIDHLTGSQVEQLKDLVKGKHHKEDLLKSLLDEKYYGWKV